eukprot:Clim_evm62s201 gene=Clim_evmTU62s201
MSAAVPSSHHHEVITPPRHDTNRTDCDVPGTQSTITSQPNTGVQDYASRASMKAHLVSNDLKDTTPMASTAGNPKTQQQQSQSLSSAVKQENSQEHHFECIMCRANVKDIDALDLHHRITHSQSDNGIYLCRLKSRISGRVCKAMFQTFDDIKEHALHEHLIAGSYNGSSPVPFDVLAKRYETTTPAPAQTQQPHQQQQSEEEPQPASSAGHVKQQQPQQNNATEYKAQVQPPQTQQSHRPHAHPCTQHEQKQQEQQQHVEPQQHATTMTASAAMQQDSMHTPEGKGTRNGHGASSATSSSTASGMSATRKDSTVTADGSSSVTKTDTRKSTKDDILNKGLTPDAKVQLTDDDIAYYSDLRALPHPTVGTFVARNDQPPNDHPWWQCALCSGRFACGGMLRDHACVPVDADAVVADGKPYRCAYVDPEGNVCGARFPKIKALSKHLNQKHIFIPCANCGVEVARYRTGRHECPPRSQWPCNTGRMPPSKPRLVGKSYNWGNSNSTVVNGTNKRKLSFAESNSATQSASRKKMHHHHFDDHQPHVHHTDEASENVDPNMRSASSTSKISLSSTTTPGGAGLKRPNIRKPGRKSQGKPYTAADPAATGDHVSTIKSTTTDEQKQRASDMAAAAASATKLSRRDSLIAHETIEDLQDDSGDEGTGGHGLQHGHHHAVHPQHRHSHPPAAPMHYGFHSAYYGHSEHAHPYPPPHQQGSTGEYYPPYYPPQQNGGNAGGYYGAVNSGGSHVQQYGTYYAAGPATTPEVAPYYTQRRYHEVTAFEYQQQQPATYGSSSSSTQQQQEQTSSEQQSSTKTSVASPGSSTLTAEHDDIAMSMLKLRGGRTPVRVVSGMR